MTFFQYSSDLFLRLGGVFVEFPLPSPRGPRRRGLWLRSPPSFPGLVFRLLLLLRCGVLASRRSIRGAAGIPLQAVRRVDLREGFGRPRGLLLSLLLPWKETSNWKYTIWHRCSFAFRNNIFWISLLVHCHYRMYSLGRVPFQGTSVVRVSI